MVYTPVSDVLLFFSQSQKTFRLSKISANLSYVHANSLTDWFEIVENISDSKSIVVHGVMSDSESKTSRPLLFKTLSFFLEMLDSLTQTEMFSTFKIELPRAPFSYDERLRMASAGHVLQCG